MEATFNVDNQHRRNMAKPVEAKLSGLSGIFQKARHLLKGDPSKNLTDNFPPLAKALVSATTAKDFPGTRFEPLFIPAPAAVMDRNTICEFDGKPYAPNPKFLIDGIKPKIEMTEFGTATLSKDSLKPTCQWPLERSTPEFEAFIVSQEELKNRMFDIDSALETAVNTDHPIMQAVKEHPSFGKEAILIEKFSFKDRPDILLVEDKYKNQFMAGLDPDGKLVLKELMPDVDPNLQARAMSKSLDPKEFGEKVQGYIEEVENVQILH